MCIDHACPSLSFVRRGRKRRSFWWQEAAHFGRLGRAGACFSFPLKRGSPLKVLHTQLPLVHAWALTINRSQGQTLDKVLLDLRHAPFSHGQAYVAISRVHIAADCGIFANDSCCIERNGACRTVLGSVIYEELLRLPSNVVSPADAAPSTNGRRPRLADLLLNLDDRTTASRVRKRLTVVEARKRARLVSRMDAFLPDLDSSAG